MDLHKEGNVYRLAFERDERRPITEVCREIIGIIATNDSVRGERIYTDHNIDDCVLLARVAIHTNTKNPDPLLLTAQELAVLKESLGVFSKPESTKRAIEQEIQRSGLLHNTHVESRVDLGRRAGIILDNLVTLQNALNHDSAAETFEPGIEDGELAAS